jgi:hypothetical protein
VAGARVSRPRTSCGSGSRTTALVAVALLVAAGLVFAPRGWAGDDITAAHLSSLLRARAVALTRARVHGDLELGRSGRVTHAFTCHECTFDGRLGATGGVFDQPVDLSRSIVAGDVDLHSAVFRRGLVADGTRFEGIVDLRGSKVLGPLELTSATFAEPALLSDARFGTAAPAGSSDFSLAKFERLATFENSTFEGNVDFSLSSFGAEANFENGEAFESVDFDHAVFAGPAGFSGFSFDKLANFSGSGFRETGDFSVADFIGTTFFTGSRFDGDVSFLGAQLFGKSFFERVTAHGRVNFTLATVSGPVDFAYMDAENLSFRDAVITVDRQLNFFNATADALDMSIPAVLQAVMGNRQRLLEMVAASAKARGDLGVANEAQYQQNVLRSRQFGWPLRTLDFAFYRIGAGYFVRPLNPLLVLAALAAVAALVRYVRRSLPAPIEPGRSFPRLRRAFHVPGHAVHGFSDEIGTTLGSVLPGGGDRDGKTRRGTARSLEIWTYRALIACALVGFANSNPTLRQMFDALR